MRFNELLQLVESNEELRHEVLYHYGKKDIKRAEGWFNKENELHRLDGPAKINYYPSGKLSTEFWYKNGKRHRIGGPAVLDYDYDGKVVAFYEYWINGMQYTKEEYDNFFKNVRPEDMDMLSDLGLSFD
jgi:antitoxin component YwqK of YwqJK toxin-antitoxin module